MRSAEKIRRLFKKAVVKTHAGPDEAVFAAVRTAYDKSLKTAPVRQRPALWRIIMKSPITRLSTAAAIIVVVALSLTFVNKTSPYALGQTIEAYRSVRYLHVKAFNTIGGRRLNSESWIEFGGDGEHARFRVQVDWFTTDAELGPATLANDGDASHLWLPKLNLCFARSGISPLTGALLQLGRLDVDPKQICEKLHQQARDGEIVLDVNEPEQEDKPIVLTVTYPAESRSANWKKVLYVDQASRLVTKEEKFEMRGEQYQHNRTTEFLDYNQQIGPERFSLGEGLAENVIVIDQSGQKVGLAQGDMTDEEIAKELTSQLLKAFVAKDSDKAGELFFGAPGSFIEQLVGPNVLKEIISVGPVDRDPDPDSNLLICSCKLIIEFGGQDYETDLNVYAVPVSGQPGRWMICRMFGSSKPAPGDPRPLEMVLIPSGTFMMGSPSDEQDRDPDEGPQHEVTLTQGFHMAKYEVTVGQYVEFLEATGEESGVDWNDHDCPLSRSGGGYTLRDGRSWNQPMAEVSWYGAVMYCNYLSEKEGLESVYDLDTWEVDWNADGYRLPTEAEWEYACRAGMQTRFYWGDDLSDRPGQETPNAFGLYDMSRNVYEWCQDWYGSYSDGSQIDPIGPGSGSNRVLRGGHDCRSAHRHKNSPDERHASIGFRLVRSDLDSSKDQIADPESTDNLTFTGNWRGEGVDSAGNAFAFAAKVRSLGDNRYRMLILDKLDTTKKPLHVMEGELKHNRFTYTADGGLYTGGGELSEGVFEGFYKGPVDGTYKMWRIGNSEMQ